MPDPMPDDPLAEFFPASPPAPGWFGKIPALGDFGSRRLSEVFIQKWDHWLASGLAASQAALGADWLDAFLHAPIWRFGLNPGLIDGRSWFGILIPSVDRVGRYYPLTICAPVNLPATHEAAGRLQEWLHELSNIALATLQEGHTLDDLEAALSVITPPEGVVIAPIAPDGPWPLVADDISNAISAAAYNALWRRMTDLSMWWCAGGTAVHIHHGLPHADSFHRLLALPGRP